VQLEPTKEIKKMKTNRLFQIIRTPVVPALALVLATATVSSAVSVRPNLKAGKGRQVHFEYGIPQDMPQNNDQDGGWYKPARSPQFNSLLH
jgi:hypothetical protein